MANDFGLGINGYKWYGAKVSDWPSTCWSISIKTMAPTPFCSTRSIAGSERDGNNGTVWYYTRVFNGVAMLLSGEWEHHGRDTIRSDEIITSIHA